MTLVRADDLHRRFDDRQVLGGVSLDFYERDFVAVIGPSGCGKTTLLQLIGVLDRPDQGTILVEGKDVWRASDGFRSGLRRTFFGFVFQHSNLLEALSTRDNVALPHWRLHGSRKQALAQADELLERLGLSERAHAHVAELSSGEAQRAAIARALVNKPKLVLADEPTGSLDAKAGNVVLDAFDSIRAVGAALLVVTHDPQVAERADRRIEIRDGRLLGTGDA